MVPVHPRRVDCRHGRERRGVSLHRLDARARIPSCEPRRPLDIWTVTRFRPDLDIVKSGREHSGPVSGRGNYHHGDLRSALLDASLRLLDAEGENAVTLREVARLTEVSHSAPTHHFGNREGLIEALSAEAARQLADYLRSATRAAGDQARSSQLIGIAYVRWAVEHPHRFRMLSRFRPSSPLETSAAHAGDESDRALGRAWESVGQSVLVETFEAGQAAGVIAAGDPLVLAMTAWATTHGLATLLLDGLLTDGPPTVEQAVHVAEEATVVLGLGLIKR